MTGRDRPIANLAAGESSTESVIAILKTVVAVVAVFGGLGAVAKTVYEVLPLELAFPGLLVTLAVLGFGGLYVTLRVRDWLG